MDKATTACYFHHAAKQVMLKVSVVLSVIVVASGLAPGSGKAAAAQRVAPVRLPAENRALVDKYCVSCHNARGKAAGLMLDKMNDADLGGGGETWEKVVRKVRVGMMPPQGMPQLDEHTRRPFLWALTTALDAAAVAHPNPGRPLLRRLNRAEYANAIHDLLALDVDPTTLLPPDDSAYGFDNIGDVLGVSPVLLERFMDAAGKVSALAVGDPDIGPGSETFRIRQDASQDVHIEGLPLGTIGGILGKVVLPLDGEYLLSVKMFRTNLGVMRGLEYEHEIEFSVDGERVHSFEMGGEADFKANLVNMTKAGDEVDERGRVRLR